MFYKKRKRLFWRYFKQKTVNEKIFQLEKVFNIPVVLTGDCHYATKEDRFAHEVMLAVQTRTTMSDPSRMTFAYQPKS